MPLVFRTGPPADDNSRAAIAKRRGVRESGVRFPSGVYAIVNLPCLAPLGERVAALIDGGVRVIQIRCKRGFVSSDRAGLRDAARCCARESATLVINDDLSLALALAADGAGPTTGVHLGQSDLDQLRVAGIRDAMRACHLVLGVSTHDLDQLDRARIFEPAYVGFGPVFATASKPDPEPIVGVAGLAAACGRSEVPVVAIGGIDERRINDCIAAGAAAVAAISALDADSNAAVRLRATGFVAAVGRARR